MRILVVNDDGIQAPGIRKLAELARQFGEVTVAAPKHQCSGMSHRITVDGGRISCEYTLQGLQCDELERRTVTDGALYVSGTHPSMDCCLTATVEAAAEQYNMAGVTWHNVQPGDILVLDGLRKRMTKNGTNAALENDAAGWPKLAPGRNVLMCPDPLTVEYYPTYL